MVKVLRRNFRHNIKRNYVSFHFYEIKNASEDEPLLETMKDERGNIFNALEHCITNVLQKEELHHNLIIQSLLCTTKEKFINLIRVYKILTNQMEFIISKEKVTFISWDGTITVLNEKYNSISQ